jgi:hypothetical protein
MACWDGCWDHLCCGLCTEGRLNQVRMVKMTTAPLRYTAISHFVFRANLGSRGSLCFRGRSERSQEMCSLGVHQGRRHQPCLTRLIPELCSATTRQLSDFMTRWYAFCPPQNRCDQAFPAGLAGRMRRTRDRWMGWEGENCEGPSASDDLPPGHSPCLPQDELQAVSHVLNTGGGLWGPGLRAK